MSNNAGYNENMSEQNKESQELAAFGENFRAGLNDLLELLAVSPDPLPPDPASMGFDERTLEELSPAEKALVQQILYQTLGVDPLVKSREYMTQAPQEATVPGEVLVWVYPTNQEGIVLQEMMFLDGDKRWVLGPDQNI